jgi:hypothetical protein
VDCLAERPSITTVLAVQPFRCVGADPVGIAFPSFGCSSNVEQQQGKYIFHHMFAYEKIARGKSEKGNVSSDNHLRRKFV